MEKGVQNHQKGVQKAAQGPSGPLLGASGAQGRIWEQKPGSRVHFGTPLFWLFFVLGPTLERSGRVLGQVFGGPSASTVFGPVFEWFRDGFFMGFGGRRGTKFVVS